jgi:hypothetical protein
MPQLARRRDPEAHHQETWHVYYGDVRVGTISERAGVPVDEDKWGWNCGFYPGTEPGEYLSGTAATFDQARAEFAKVWPVFLSKRTDADFTAFRRHRAMTAWKYAMRDAGLQVADAGAGAALALLLRRRDRRRLRGTCLRQPHGGRVSAEDQKQRRAVIWNEAYVL